MKQISLITENRLGVVTDLTEALANAGINIETIDAEQLGDRVVIVLTVNPYDRALAVCRHIDNVHVITEDAILVKLKDEPGALAKIARRFTDAGIGMRSIRIIERNSNYALVAISTTRTDAALKLVADVLVS